MYESRHSKHSRHEFDMPVTRRRPRTEPVRRLARTRVQRRDEFQPKVVKSNYDIEAWDTVFGKGSGLQPVRDTGIALQSRRDMRLAQKKRQFNVILVVALTCLFVFLFTGVIWMQRSDAKGRSIAKKASIASAKAAQSKNASTFANKKSSSKTALITSPSLGSSIAAGISQESREESVTASNPTPQLATYKNIKIHLPVSVKNLTEVAFHQASYSYALPMETHLPIYSLEKARNQKGTRRDKSTQPEGLNTLLCGSALEYWRSGRHTGITTAVDCGAAASSLVYAPISGTVSKICTYNYENKVDDYEIHIIPDDHPHLEVVLIHVKSPYIVEGDRVTGGVTPIARVRKMSAYVRNQLATYTGHGGNHTHIQINNTASPAYAKRHKADGTESESDAVKVDAGASSASSASSASKSATKSASH